MDTEKSWELLIACVGNRERLSKLTNKALINEILGSNLADYDIVVELMNRVLPGWEQIEGIDKD